MNCLFCCKKQLELIDMHRSAVLRYMECSTCETIFVYDKDSSIELVRYFFHYRGYKLNFWPEIIETSRWNARNRPNFKLEFESKKDEITLLLELKYLPNITPHNVERKIKTLLTFL